MEVKKKRKSAGYWTKENIHEEALKYNSQKEFNKNARGAYKAAYKGGFLKEVISHMIDFTASWSKEKIIEIAKSCKTRTEFQKKYKKAYTIARDNGYYEEICKHMTQKRVYKTKTLSKDDIIILALKCKTRTEFCKKYARAFKISKKEGYYEEICSHMKKRSLMPHPRFVYVFELSNNYAYVGLTQNAKTRLREHLNRKGNKKIYNFIVEQNIDYVYKVLTDTAISELDAQELEHNTKLEYIKNGWGVLNGGATGKFIGSLGATEKWTFETAFNESLKYKSKEMFSKGAKGAYAFAIKNKILHVFYPEHDYFRWNHDTCINESKKYSTRNLFRIGAHGAHGYAIRHGLLDSLFPKPKRWNKEMIIELSKKYTTRGQLQDNFNGAYKYAAKHNLLDEIYPKKPKK